mgnify:CR=1 FL=1
MVVKVRTLEEDKVVEAVQYAVSTKFNLDELSQLLVMEGGVDLDMLAKIIRENRGAASADCEEPVTQPTFLHQAMEDKKPKSRWLGLRLAS